MPWNRPCCSYQLEIFREYAQICAPCYGTYTCHASDDPEGSKLCPQDTILCFSLMPSSSDTL